MEKWVGKLISGKSTGLKCLKSGNIGLYLVTTAYVNKQRRQNMNICLRF